MSEILEWWLQGVTGHAAASSLVGRSLFAAGQQVHRCPSLLAFTARDVTYQVIIFFLALMSLYGLVRLVDMLGLGRRRSPHWRFLGTEPKPGQARRQRSRHREVDEDPFEVLGITPTEDLDAINAAYIRLARKTHPDLNPNDARAKEKFQRVQYAFSRVGNETALRLFLADHPLQAAWDVMEPESKGTVVDLDLFQQELASYRMAWRMKQSMAERDLKYLQGGSPPGLPALRKLKGWLKKWSGRAAKRRIAVERVVFLVEERGTQDVSVPHLQVYDKLLRVGTQQQLHDVVSFLLRYNDVYFVDRFHTRDKVSFHDIGRRPGQNAALSPSGSYAEFVTNLAKLGLYEGADVRQVG